MKKRIAATMAAGAAAVLMLSGFDSSMTAVQVQEKAKEAIAQAESFTIDLQGSGSANLSVKQEVENGAAMDIPINGNTTASWQISMEPFQMDLNVSYTAEAMGQGMDGQMEMILVENEDGSASTYEKVSSTTEPGEWQAGTMDAQTLTGIRDMVRSALAGDTTVLSGAGLGNGSMDAGAIAGLVEKYQEQLANMVQLSPNPVDVNGKECYALSLDLQGEILTQMVSDVLSASGQTPDDTTWQMMQAVLGGFRIQIESAIDTQTFLPVSGSVDLGGSDFSAIEQLLLSSVSGGAEGMAAHLDVSALNVACDFGFNEPVSVTVPQEALDAGSASPDLSLNTDDLIGSLLNGGGTDVGDLGGADTGADQQEGPVMNADGTYRITYEDYQGNVRKADIAVPEGMVLSYGSDDYISFRDESFSKTVSYSLYTMDTPEETVESDLDVSYMEGNSEYRDVTRTDVLQTTLEDGTVVSYGFKGYFYGDYRLGGTECALQAGDSVVDFEIQFEDENLNVYEVSEEDVRYFASLIRPAA